MDSLIFILQISYFLVHLSANDRRFNWRSVGFMSHPKDTYAWCTQSKPQRFIIQIFYPQPLHHKSNSFSIDLLEMSPLNNEDASTSAIKVLLNGVCIQVLLSNKTKTDVTPLLQKINAIDQTLKDRLGSRHVETCHIQIFHFDVVSFLSYPQIQ